jgi:hypothetical protein
MAPLPPSAPRKSRSGDGARRLQIARELAMTARERALLALRLGQRGRDYLELAQRPR